MNDSDDTDVEMHLTPFGAFAMDCQDFGIDDDVVQELWFRLEAFCIKRLKSFDPDASFACLVFDGAGGDVIGVDDQSD